MPSLPVESLPAGWYECASWLRVDYADCTGSKARADERFLACASLGWTTPPLAYPAEASELAAWWVSSLDALAQSSAVTSTEAIALAPLFDCASFAEAQTASCRCADEEAPPSTAEVFCPVSATIGRFEDPEAENLTGNALGSAGAAGVPGR